MNDLDLEHLTVLGIAAALGAVLGMEREIAGKPAGIRTLIFVAVGSAFMMILGQSTIDRFQETESFEALQADPIRIIQAIVIGISFLGAGTIVHDRREGVEGLTTAATIYVTSAIGIAVASDRVFLAVAVTVFAALVLVVVGVTERRVQRWHETRQRREEKGDQ